ncbi:MAG: hypothetical protein MUE73_20410 [Planctomycetes bacterium]|nr:hypothetical protein [Planctomycetota bacterium]
MWIGCGHQHEPEDSFLVFLEPSKPEIRRWWFKRVRTVEDVERLADAVGAVLKSDPGIRDLRWEEVA